jgi:hypothetical protein
MCVLHRAQSEPISWKIGRDQTPRWMSQVPEAGEQTPSHDSGSEQPSGDAEDCPPQMPRELPIDAVRPSQLYLSGAKLASVVERFDFEDPDYDPLPAFEHEGSWYLSDGHTRAFAAYLAGAETFRERWIERCNRAAGDPGQ